ncbi:thiamine pyrophosphate-dependent dehydrogenase E1 component subunit alpha [Pimelobacter simplex]|uniref:thiamine pyrophosphate-dependent dehydrogenase E1 component subunit alpha n=1 Tax=Nocardioides simplex TaxID=2045 RepID=UPI0021501235|nr:thiamine pyrophosphate-dependent dehydrogenase E1 component subunit alpha [Pimelobacter simplex]UUW89038.1 thiamine pyrophosphate-dependent dehydrogenase E1 component subunit alpha [Pimelobacter simplex]UUW98542.1 thiamine pyrophosphate-dependent dehydrogenase E1 component subunit alpha [Pimelobacter simplex]
MSLTETGLWEAMVEARAFDQAMCRHNGHWHEARGEEAVFVGAFADLGADDVVAPHFRGACAVALHRGADPATLAAGVFGTDASGSGGHWRGDICPAPGTHAVGMFSGSLGTSVAYATGAALHLSRTRPGAVAVCGFGDGTANSGIVAESLNLAAMLALPIVYVCQDNQYATSLPSSVALAGERVSDRARALGITASDVDGNDVRAVRAAVTAAVDHARSGAGPAFVHALTYRMGGHYMNDPETYRSPEEVAAWAERDPIARLEDDLVATGILDRAGAEARSAAAHERMDAIVAAAKAASDAALVRATSPYAEDLRSAS